MEEKKFQKEEIKKKKDKNIEKNEKEILERIEKANAVLEEYFK